MNPSSDPLDAALQALRSAPAYPERLEYAFETRFLARWKSTEIPPWWAMNWTSLPFCGGAALLSGGAYLLASTALQSALSQSLVRGGEVWFIPFF